MQVTHGGDLIAEGKISVHVPRPEDLEGCPTAEEHPSTADEAELTKSQVRTANFPKHVWQSFSFCLKL